jgi:hypothetical protein
LSESTFRMPVEARCSTPIGLTNRFFGRFQPLFPSILRELPNILFGIPGIMTTATLLIRSRECLIVSSYLIPLNIKLFQILPDDISFLCFKPVKRLRHEVVANAHYRKNAFNSFDYTGTIFPDPVD